MLAVAQVAGCAALEGEGTEPKPTTRSAVATTEPDTSPADRSKPSASDNTRATGRDWTAELVNAAAGEPWADAITSAVETEPGRLEVSTTIVDPRGDDGSPEAQLAIAVCEAAVGLLEGAGAGEGAYVAVFEDDGTHFVLYGHPRVTEGECTEI